LNPHKDWPFLGLQEKLDYLNFHFLALADEIELRGGWGDKESTA